MSVSDPPTGQDVLTLYYFGNNLLNALKRQSSRRVLESRLCGCIVAIPQSSTKVNFAPFWTHGI
jgi:hypothetical protein